MDPHSLNNLNANGSSSGTSTIPSPHTGGSETANSSSDQSATRATVPPLPVISPESDWQTPIVFGMNNLPPHSPLHGYLPITLKEQAGKTSTSALGTLCLNGIWQFKLVEAPQQVPSGFQQFEFNASDWGTIPVPSNWQLQKNCPDIPIYTNYAYPFYYDPPRVPECNPTGLYRHSFTVPEEWRAHANEIFTYLVFEGVNACFYVWLNEVFVGYSQDSRLPAEFDVSSILHFGDHRDGGGGGSKGNLLVVQVMRWCDGSYCEDQDFWWLSGIFRDVHLYCKSLAHFTDFTATPYSCDFETHTAELKLSVDITYSPRTPQARADVECVPSFVEIYLYPSVKDCNVNPYEMNVDRCCCENDEATSSSSSSETPPRPRSLSPSAVLASLQLPLHPYGGPTFALRESGFLRVENVRFWSDEDPYLYQLQLKLCNYKGKVLDYEICSVGFRSVCVTPEGVLLFNGKRLLIRGVNRHEHHPTRGHYITREDMVSDSP